MKCFRLRLLLSLPLSLAYKSAQYLSIHLLPSSVEVRTSVTRFRRENTVVDLYSLLHIGEKAYYEELTRRLEEYDIVLFELITSRQNVVLDEGRDYRRRLVRNVFSPKTSALAAEYNLSCQLDDIDFTREKYFIADLEAEDVASLEKKQAGFVWKRYFASLIAGPRASSSSISSSSSSSSYPADRLTLKKFFLPLDALLTNSLRLLCWTCPCPELSALLVDWSRAQAGGVPEVIGPILQCLLRGQIKDARRILFGQELVTGLADSGEWGGAAFSNTNVRVGARNEECLRVLESIVKEEQKKGRSLADLNSEDALKELRVAILYGAFHSRDLTNKLSAAGYTLESKEDKNQGDCSNRISEHHLTAWSVASPQVTTFAPQVLLGSGLVLAYLFLGALDWYLLLYLLGEGARVAWTEASSDLTTPVLSLFYLATYVQRHSGLFNRASSVGIDWQEGLFDRFQ